MAKLLALSLLVQIILTAIFTDLAYNKLPTQKFSPSPSPENLAPTKMSRRESLEQCHLKSNNQFIKTNFYYTYHYLIILNCISYNTSAILPVHVPFSSATQRTFYLEETIKTTTTNKTFHIFFFSFSRKPNRVRKLAAVVAIML
jgi:hypothetical protein